MAIAISSLAKGLLPIVERKLPLLEGHPEGDTIKIQLLSRGERLRIYPERDLKDSASLWSRGRDAQKALDDAELLLERAVSTLDATAIMTDSDPETERLTVERDEARAALEPLLKEQLKVETERLAAFWQAVLVDDSGDQMTIEQAREVIESRSNESLTEQISYAIFEAHGMITIGADGKAVLPGE